MEKKLMIEKLELKEEDTIVINANNESIACKVYLDNQITGEIAYVSTFDKELNTKSLFLNSRYNVALVKKA